MTEQTKITDNMVPSDDAIATLIDALTSTNGVERNAAREKLVANGRLVVPPLLAALKSPSDSARWEAAKALVEIGDPSAAPALVIALEDGKAAVRWLAATALINLGHDALVPLLEGLEGSSDSIWFRDGAHHVLRSLIRDGEAGEAIPVLEALENLEPAVEAPIAAYHVLEEMRDKGKVGASPAL